ncbi:rRNA methylase [Secundilactobacillus odoratitofui DSM 19909 = JCM 15043]|uniref:rRNA methylase n=1 Tax=Secundilactobacillus odoratitofui DSM 19909 = JCM 15043 TaxID=1423776 RepID=A0A0R1LY42_9LACO|nr:rRNA methylase [Secundilactobacillus odoratitofui DSM 19909 = JCM 15043]
MIEKISSTQNAKVKKWQHLTTKKGHQKYHQYLVEGWHIVGDAITAGQPIVQIAATPAQLAQHQAQLPANVEVFEINDDIAKKLSDTVTPQGIFAVVEILAQQHVNATEATGGWLLLDRIQDPGNIGTMVRTADAAGFTGVVFGQGTSSRYTPKVIRAMQGSQFHIQLTEGDLSEWVTDLKQRGIAVYGSALDEHAQDYSAVEPTADLGLIMGNEGQGMSAELMAATTQNLYIPIKGNAESLNVAVAAGVLMFQLNANLR